MSDKCKMSSVPTGSANLADIKCLNIDCARLMRLKKHFLTEEAESKCCHIMFYFFFIVSFNCKRVAYRVRVEALVERSSAG